ncbi:replicative DNA helicase [Salinibacter altiplanensis]|uniref:replicative DNA helicase n=1 Tax=Salinibacter altiplanensis TaxID=1803181 RepID=UPI000C9F449C|nr:replicative DNA helicase [Salinibacter altiplanensis]
MSTQNGTHSEGKPAEAPLHTAHDLEQVVLGAAMIDEEACAAVVDLCEPAFFADRSRRHREIFEAIAGLFGKDGEAPLPAVQQRLGADGVEVKPTYLTDLTAEVGATTGIGRYARILQEKCMARQGRRVLEKAKGHLDDGGDVFETLGGVVDRLTKISMTESDQTHIKHGAQEALSSLKEWEEGEVTGLVPTGFPGLDDICDGYPVGELTTFAAHTGAGKTSFIVQTIATLARAWQDQEKALLIFSAEMDKEQIAQKAASQIAEVNLRELRRGTAPDEDYDAMEEALGLLSRLTLHVDDTASPSMQHIRARCQRIAAQTDRSGELAFVALDYDEKVQGQGETEEQRVASIATGSKAMAKRLDVAWINLSQYKRMSDPMGTPSDSWLRYSGKKEQESALILHWYWPGYWVQNKGNGADTVPDYDANEPGKGWMYATKNRITGGTGAARLYFRPEQTRFIDPKDPGNEPQPHDRQPHDRTQDSPF